MSDLFVALTLTMTVLLLIGHLVVAYRLLKGSHNG